MNIFLTGATGFVGKKFLLLALKKDHFVFALTRKNQKFKHKNLKWLKGPITKKWNHELKNTDVIVHFASAGVRKKNIPYYEAKKFNVTDSLSLFKNAAKNNCKKWIIAGTASEYGSSCIGINKINVKTEAKPNTAYEKTKYMFTKKIEILSRITNSKCRVMRIFPVYGEGESNRRFYPSIVQAAKKNKKFIVKNSEQIRDFTEVKLVSNVILDACNFKKRKFDIFQIWHVSSGKPLKLKDFAKKIWKKHKSEGKLIFESQENKNYHNYVSDKKSIWRV